FRVFLELQDMERPLLVLLLLRVNADHSAFSPFLLKMRMELIVSLAFFLLVGERMKSMIKIGRESFSEPRKRFLADPRHQAMCRQNRYPFAAGVDERHHRAFVGRIRSRAKPAAAFVAVVERGLVAVVPIRNHESLLFDDGLILRF